jgi:(2Fe-2S) ferredoxin
MICQHRSCLKNGSAEVLAAFQARKISEVEVQASSCLGQCTSGPTVRVLPDEIWYCRIQPSDVPEIVEQHLQQGKVVEAKLNPRIHLRMETFFSP